MIRCAQLMPDRLQQRHPRGGHWCYRASSLTINRSWLILKQDNTPGQSYDRVIYFLLAIKGVQVLLGPLYDYLDGRLLGHTLRKSEKERLDLAVNMAQQDVVLPGWRIHLPTTWTVICQLGIMVVVSWVVSFTSCFSWQRTDASRYISYF